MPVSGVYTATGGEAWITIGNFNPIGQTELDTLALGNVFTAGNYYYIDDVFVIPMGDGGLLPRDTGICASGFPYLLHAFDGFTNYLWDNGTAGQALLVAGRGRFALSARFADCTIHDTIEIKAVLPTALDLQEIVVCEDSLPFAYTIPDSLGLTNIAWENGASGPTVLLAAPGAVGMTATGTCGLVADTLTLRTAQRLQVEIGEDRSLCDNGELLPALLQNSGSLPNYRWSTGETSPTLLAEKPGTFTLFSENECGTFQDQVKLTGCEPRVYLPNVFHPGSVNSPNQAFLPFASNATIAKLEVFDRWG